MDSRYASAHPFIDLFTDSEKEITCSLDVQFLDLRSNQDEDEDEVEGNIAANAFLNLLHDFCGKGVVTRWNAWLEKNGKDSVIIIDEDQCTMDVRRKKRRTLNLT